MTFTSGTVRSGWDRLRGFASAVYPRLVGALLVFKLMIPLLIMGLLTACVWSMVSSANAELDRLNAALQPRFERVEADIERLRAEGRRLAVKVATIKSRGVQVAREVKQLIEPIRQSLVVIASTLGAMSKTLVSVVNPVVRAVNKLPRVNLPTIDLPDIRIPGFSLPNLEIDLDLQFDMAPVEALKEASVQIADEAEATLATLKSIWLTWWWTFKVVASLLLCWLLISLVGMAARFWHRLRIGVQLLCGRTSAATLQLL